MNSRNIVLRSKHWKWIVTASLLAVLSTTTTAYAQHEAGNAYVGVAAGYHLAPEISDGPEGLNALNASWSAEDGILGWSAYGGYFVVNNLAIEAGWLGSADMDIELRVEDEIIDGNYSLSAFYGALVGYVPRPFASMAFPFLKIGLARWESDFSFTVDDLTIAGEGDGTAPLLGAGVDVLGLGDLSVRGEYVFLWIDDDDGGSQHRFQVGVNFAF